MECKSCSQWKWIPWKGTARVKGNITHLIADDSSDPNEDLYMDSCNVRIKGDEVEVRVGAVMYGSA